MSRTTSLKNQNM